MAEEQLCQSCGQRHDCEQIYRQMGNVKGPCIAVSVLLVFLLPIAVFIGGLVISQSAIARLIQKQSVAILTSFIFAAAMSFLVILVVRSVLKKR